MPPPDFGSLRDWHVRQADLQRRRREQALRARQKMASLHMAQARGVWRAAAGQAGACGTGRLASARSRLSLLLPHRPATRSLTPALLYPLLPTALPPVQEHLDDDQVLDWLAQAEVAVQLGPGDGGAAAAAGPDKEVPLWFRGGAGAGASRARL